MDKISRHSAILIPPGTEKDNLELKVVNYILYGNGKSIRGISDTRIQLVRTCLVFNWDDGKNSSSIEEAPASFIEVRTNESPADALREKPAGKRKQQSRHRALFIPKEGKETLEVNLEKTWSRDQRKMGSGVGYAKGRY
ncbi:hypothetical protein KIW84_UN0894 [Lathyrus oleraceus]|nr:hypothetical protein KIW84_UN0894 [Pisum sativum]